MEITNQSIQAEMNQFNSHLKSQIFMIFPL